MLDDGGPAEVAGITDAAAALFLRIRSDRRDGEARRRLLNRLAAVPLADRPAEFRVPEGFAWYALFPEAYAQAAERWAAAHPGASVVVIGLRSIGTSLSAVVAEALREAGTGLRARMTLRPGGHPFHRTAMLARDLPSADAALVVDEGPGLSGSSMAGAADALLSRGFPDRAIHFFPGHGDGPGGAGNARSRRWWRGDRCWSTPQHELTIGGRRLHEVLADVARRHGGQPASWRFGGFAAVDGELRTLARRSAARQARLAAEGLAMPLAARAHGFLLCEDHGEAVDHADLGTGFIRERLAPFIARAALPPEGEDDPFAALGRIADALACLDDADRGGLRAEDFASFRESAARHATSGPRAGSGRLGPAEWRRLADGRALKRDAAGSDCEHSWAGAQSVLWDVAGAIAEWEMREDQAALLRDVLCETHGIRWEAPALAFHQAGYCALELARALQAGESTRAGMFRRRLGAALADLREMA